MTDAAVVTDEMRNAALSTFYALPAASLAPPYHESMTEALTAALAHLPPPSAELVEARTEIARLTAEITRLNHILCLGSAELERLGKKIAQGREGFWALRQENTAFRAQITALEASNKAMRDDAERFEWLVRNHSVSGTGIGFRRLVGIDWLIETNINGPIPKMDHVRRLIDAARATSSPPRTEGESVDQTCPHGKPLHQDCIQCEGV